MHNVGLYFITVTSFHTFLAFMKGTAQAVSAPAACDARDFFGHGSDATWIGFGSIFIALRTRKKCLDQSGVMSVTWQGNLVWQGQLSPRLKC